MFWMIVLVLALGLLRSFFPRGGFDEVRTGEVPLEVAGSDDGVWVLNHADHSVSLIETAEQEILFEVAVGDDVAPTLSANDDGAWVILDGGDTIARIDPGTEAVEDRIDVADTFSDGTPAQDLAAGPDFVWVTTGETGEMVRIDTADGSIGDVIDVGDAVVQPQVLGDSLWVYESDGVTEYDNTSGEEIEKINTSNRRVHDFWVTEENIWLLADIDNVAETGFVVRLDREGADPSIPAARERGQYRLQNTRPSRITVADGQVFVSGSGGLLMELTADDDAAIRLLATEQVAVSTKDLKGLIVQDGTVWIADGTNGVVHQPISGIEGENLEDEPVD
jgi:streptogramin lyase